MNTDGREGSRRGDDGLLMAIIHDIRRHLRTTVGRAQMIERDESSGTFTPAVRSHLDTILAAGRETNLLLSRLAQYTAAGLNVEDPGSGDVSVMFDSALRRVAERNQNADIDSKPLIGSGIRVPYTVETILRELLDNALKFRQGPVKITVLVESSAGSHVIGIKDTGIGFDPQFGEKIMLPLERLHSQDAYGGPGLGLAICQRTVRAIGGKLWAESKLNGGSTFWFSVPAN